MQVPSARLIISSNGSCVTVHPGGLIGRLANAEMMIADPRISEAHALVSLRSRSLRLLALRGALAVDGLDVDAVTLEEGLRVELADGLFITVESIELTTHTLVLYGTAQGRVERRIPSRTRRCRGSRRPAGACCASNDRSNCLTRLS